MNTEWIDFISKGHVIFAPLVINEKTVGIIWFGEQGESFNDNDAKMATG